MPPTNTLLTAFNGRPNACPTERISHLNKNRGKQHEDLPSHSVTPERSSACSVNTATSSQSSLSARSTGLRDLILKQQPNCSVTTSVHKRRPITRGGFLDDSSDDSDGATVRSAQQNRRGAPEKSQDSRRQDSMSTIAPDAGISPFPTRNSLASSTPPPAQGLNMSRLKMLLAKSQQTSSMSRASTPKPPVSRKMVRVHSEPQREHVQASLHTKEVLKKSPIHSSAVPTAEWKPDCNISSRPCVQKLGVTGTPKRNAEQMLEEQAEIRFPAKRQAFQASYTPPDMRTSRKSRVYSSKTSLHKDHKTQACSGSPPRTQSSNADPIEPKNGVAELLPRSKSPGIMVGQSPTVCFETSKSGLELEGSPSNFQTPVEASAIALVSNGSLMSSASAPEKLIYTNTSGPRMDQSLLQEMHHPLLNTTSNTSDLNVSLNSSKSHERSALNLSEKGDCAESQSKLDEVISLCNIASACRDAEPYFEFSIFQKVWSNEQEETEAVAREIVSRSFTCIDEANSQAQKLFDNDRENFVRVFHVRFSEWYSKIDEHACKSWFGTFASLEYPSRTKHIKVWVQRDFVSKYASRPPTEALQHTHFVSNKVYILRLFRLDTPLPASEFEGPEEAKPTIYQRILQPLPCVEVYTTLDAANIAAKNLQIELSHEKSPKNGLTKMWQENNSRQLNFRLQELRSVADTEGTFWQSEFNGVGLGSNNFELVVEKAGICGPKNL